MIKQKLFFSVILFLGLLLALNLLIDPAASATTSTTTTNHISNTDKSLVSTETSQTIKSQTSAEESISEADVGVKTAVSNRNPLYKKYIVFVVKVTNNGPDTAKNIRINSWLNRTYMKWIKDDGNGFYNRQTGIWSINSLGSGNSVSLHLVGQIIRPNTKFNQKIFLASSATTDTNPDNNKEVISLTVPKAVNLSVTQKSSSYHPGYLHHVVITVVVKNKGPNAAENLTASCSLDPNILKYLSDNGKGAYNFRSGVWDIGTLRSGSQVTLRITAKVMVFETSIRNIVSIQSKIFDMTAGNNRAGIVMNVPKLTIGSLATSLSIGTRSKYDRAVNIFYWVRDYVSYAFYYNTRYGADGTLDHLEGNCVDLSHLLVALARTVGISARYKLGNCYFISSQHWYGHVWANFYVYGPQGLKWYPVDASNNINDFGVIKNWNTSNFKLRGIYNKLPF